jgi:hypothetical protein
MIGYDKKIFTHLLARAGINTSSRSVVCFEGVEAEFFFVTVLSRLSRTCDWRTDS